MATQLILRNENGEYAVSTSVTELTVTEMFETLITPLLLAAGYSLENINDHIA